MSRFGMGLGLLGLWVLLWGELSAANVVSGILVLVLLVVVLPDVRRLQPRPRSSFRPIPYLRFLARVAAEVVRANVVLTREVVSRGSSIRTGVVRVPLPGCSDGLLTLVANVLALTPGTMPVEVERNPAVIYVHVLHLRDVGAVRRDVQDLAGLAIAAFGSDEAVAAVTQGTDRPVAGPPEVEP